MISLSYTMAKRYERCGELARQWKEKLVKEQIDQKPFFVGRVVHRAFEAFLRAPTEQPMQSFLAAAWAEEEKLLVGKLMSLRWVEGERSSEYQRAAALLAKLDGQTQGLRKLNFIPELKMQAQLTPEVAMFAKPDLWGEHAHAPMVYVVELKSGVSYDPDQPDWYAAVDAVLRTTQQRSAVHYVAVALRPATDTPIETRTITHADMLKQIERAYGIACSMDRGEWVARPQGFCSMCEGRELCPDYQAKFGGLRPGRISLSGA